jgi:hypothetical protein
MHKKSVKKLRRTTKLVMIKTIEMTVNFHQHNIWPSLGMCFVTGYTVYSLYRLVFEVITFCVVGYIHWRVMQACNYFIKCSELKLLNC